MFSIAHQIINGMCKSSMSSFVREQAAGDRHGLLAGQPPSRGGHLAMNDRAGIAAGQGRQSRAVVLSGIFIVVPQQSNRPRPTVLSRMCERMLAAVIVVQPGRLVVRSQCRATSAVSCVRPLKIQMLQVRPNAVSVCLDARRESCRACLTYQIRCLLRKQANQLLDCCVSVARGPRKDRLVGIAPGTLATFQIRPSSLRGM